MFNPYSHMKLQYFYKQGSKQFHVSHSAWHYLLFLKVKLYVEMADGINMYLSTSL